MSKSASSKPAGFLCLLRNTRPSDLSLEFSCLLFVLVSDFDIRISDLLLAIVDTARDFSTEVFARHDAIDEAVFHEEFVGLEAFGQLEADGVPDGALAGEADEGARLG